MKYFTAAFLLALIALCAVLYILPGKIRQAVLDSEPAFGYEAAATTYPIWLFTREITDGTGREVILLTPPDGKVTDYENYLAFQMQADDSDESLVFVFSNGASRRAVRNFRLHGLDPAADYRVEKLFDGDASAEMRSGAALMRYGVRTELPENQHIRHTAGLYRISRI